MKPSEPGELTIFDAARQLASGSERAAYLDHACADDPKLRGRVEALLRAGARADEFLAGDPLQLGERPPVAPSATAPASEAPGAVIDKYKLLEKLGEGGCGVVYMAEQQEPVRRKVALKVIKLGMDTRQVVARFEAERQALALMDHPNIAKVLDAGATETGRPYFVMELVGGIKITDYCEQNHLTTQQRLDLFIQVCHAIQHAHQKGTIHRDIKPSNVLVATHDGVPVPKVIDFGIAKATQGRLSNQTVFTAFEQFLGTPAYMSPEQAQLGSLDVDTRSDIYSLGVLLYELLTGKTPFDAKELLAVGLEAMRRTICEKEPPTPSTRLKQETAARSVSTDKSALRAPHSALDKDLDWIVMKCLEKDRARRYETASGLAMDIQRHLTNEPVVASPPSRLYRFQKLVRRNRATATATAAVAVVLVVGAAVSAWQAVRATRAERQSKQEAAKSQQVAELLSEMFKGAGPSKAQGHDPKMLLEILDRTAERVTKEFTNQPEVQLQLLPILANTYRDLGLYKRQDELARENLMLAQTSYGSEHPAVAQALTHFASARRRLGDYEQAETSSRQALAMQRKLSGNDSLEAARALHALALVLMELAKLKEAEAAFTEVLVILRKRLGKDDQEVANVLSNLAAVLRMEGRLAEAEASHRENLALRRRLLGSEHLDVANSLNGLAVVLNNQGKLAEAETAAREALAIQRKVLGTEHPTVGNTLNNLAISLGLQGKHAEAETALRDSLAVQRKRFGQEHAVVANTLDNLATLLSYEGKLDESEAMQREALAMKRKLLGDEHPDTTSSLAHLGSVLEEQGKLTEAELVYREWVAVERKRPGNEITNVAASLNCLALALLKKAGTGQTESLIEAEALAHEVLTIREQKMPEDWQTFSTRRLLGACLLCRRKYVEAEPVLLSAYEGMKQREASIPAPSKVRLKEALQTLVQLYEEQGRSDQAAQWRQQLEDFERAQTNRPAAKPPA